MRLDNKGVSLIEVIVVLGLLALVITVFGRLNAVFSMSVSSASLNVRANAIAVETIEAVRFLRDDSWGNISGLSPETDYYLSFSDSDREWHVEYSNPGNIDGIFLRKFSTHSVFRDSVTGQIVSSGGIPDSDTLRVDAEVLWNDRGNQKNYKLTSYFSDF